MLLPVAPALHTSACNACRHSKPHRMPADDALALQQPADQLQRAVEVNEYAEAARLLEAVQQLSAHFQSFVSIPKVAELGGRVSMLQRALQVLPLDPRDHTATLW